MKDHEEVTKKSKIIRRNRIIAGVCAVAVLGTAFFAVNKIANKRKSAIVNAANAANEKKESENKTKNQVSKEEKSVPAGAYKPWSAKRTDGKKVAYLTFDDGPSPNTTKILEILNKNNIKATFFLIGQNAERNPELVKKEIAAGNVVGNHTYSHQLNYKEGPQKFVEDLDRGNAAIKSVIGDKYDSKLIRFPGGSFGNRLAPFRDAVTKAGYHYVDWNDETGDAEHSNVPVEALLSNLKKYTNSDTVVILMHDAGAKVTSVQALPQVIDYLKSKGYTFDTLK
ncbi:polysaccharide deacetylase [Clostridium sp. P21]|uniref:Polysaccharide deacetylase n=1 Tax=Clostridium muellerianum TaxID=2716538 RepID=A0A7Y0EGF8_9CLOT|nr:polysaccharide deacetylase family protein [Clostridium muellerianum]NMM62931.1 polysaccharide deacetylase [Clostridium muellerianum]